MPDISVSSEQLAYIEALRDELAREITYGHVRTRDAVQYLIDHHRTDGDLDVDVEADEDSGRELDADADADPDTGNPGTDDRTDTSNPDAVETTTVSTSVDETVRALSTADSGAETGDTTVHGDDSGMVDQMMNLLDTHREVWEETDSSDGKYRVELPEGESQHVQTKADVRKLLFEHYR